VRIDDDGVAIDDALRDNADAPGEEDSAEGAAGGLAEKMSDETGGTGG
jgi:hypothetical protein